MSTGYAITPLQAGEEAELSRFLTRGFQLPADVECMSAEVLRWKYLGPSARQGPASLIARAGGQIVGHVGLCPRTFVGQADGSREVSTTHPIDWLASPEHPSVGLLLLLRGFGSTQTQYSIGGTGVAQKVLQAIGFERRCRIEVYRKIMRPIHHSAATRQGLLRKVLGAARDLVQTWPYGEPAPGRRLELRRVTAFGPETADVLSRCRGPLLFSSRTPDLLNDYLRYPSGSISGWSLHEAGRPVGLALLSVLREGKVRRGRLAECFLEDTDEALWQAALAVLTAELRQQSADDVTCFASTPWMARALQQNGYRPTHTTEFLLRDRNKLLPRDLPCHLTQLEGDHAYLQ
jgi:hypothetical protein